MASQSTQISASVSKETKKLLDAYTRKRGIKKSFVIEQALRHRLLAAEEIPEEFIVPPVDAGPHLRPGTPRAQHFCKSLDQDSELQAEH